MDLKSFIQQERGSGVALAAKLDIPPSYLSQMASGDRTVSPERASAIERATDGVVRRWDLRPEDWHLIWPELIGVDGAPGAAEPTVADATTQAAAAGA